MQAIFRESVITAIVLSISAYAPAYAGSATNNTTTIRNSTGSGYSEFSSLRNSVGVQNNYSQSLKMESLGEFAEAEVIFKDSKFTGSAYASTDEPVDPYAIGVYSSQSETINFTQTDNAKGYENYEFTEHMTDHRVGADSW